MRKKSGINMSDVKMSNRSLILNQIKDHAKSRKDIAEGIHLTPAAVTILVNELIEQGCIRESGQVSEPSRVGRKKVLIELNKTYKYVIGINIEGMFTSVGIGNLRGEVLSSKILSSDKKSAQELLEEIGQLVIELIDQYELSKEEILGIGVGMVGVVDRQLGIAKNSYGLWDKKVNIKATLEKLVGIPVVLENNVRSLALAEMALKDNRKISNMVFIKIGPGLGSALILNNEIYCGSNNMSGEIGHMVIGHNDKKCSCGQTGCLETIASVKGLIRSIEEDFSELNYPVLFKLVGGQIDKIKETGIMKAYKLGDQGIINKVNLLIEYLSIGIVNLFKMYDPKKIVIYGLMFSDKFFMNRLILEIKDCYKIDQVEDRIEQSFLGQEKCIGGMVIVIRRLFYNNGAELINQIN